MKENYREQILSDELDERKSIIFKQLEEIEYLKQTLREIKEMTSKHNYWGSNLVKATELINAIEAKVDEVIK